MAERKKTTSKQRKSSKGKARKGYLVIVESPAKSKTINKILGKEYKVLASMGHIIDLPSDKMGIDFDDGFTPKYSVMKGRAKHLKDIKQSAKNVKAVYLAADPDREGEAICWHIGNQLEETGLEIYRVRFEEITARAVKAAFESQGAINMDLVNAQQARRVLDRIVGYSLSPLLWKMITRGLSAGRVQSVSVRLIVEREEDIRKFVPQEYWSLEVLLAKGHTQSDEKFNAKLVKHKGEKIHIKNKEESDKVLTDLEGEDFIVKDITRREKKSYPRAPYTTSVLQQDAFNKLNFSASKTMRIAQRLYEGIELGEEESIGLITYMRTDAVRISEESAEEAKKYITETYGEKYYPAKRNEYKSKKSAQEAHEAIRPTLPLRAPDNVRDFLSPDEFKLYSLIWKKFVSSQMKNALYSVLTVHVSAGDYDFRAGGTDIIFDGFLKVYRDEGETVEGMKDMPSLEKNEKVALCEFIPDQHFTKAPPRYSDASLVKVLEEKGIGRPSTYAPIIRTIIDRNYVKRVQRYFQPTELGEMVNKFLVENFANVVDYEFTANLENELDDIEGGKREWVNVLDHFYGPFSKRLEEVKEKLKNTKKKGIETGEKCTECGKPMVVKWGRRGKFLSCSDFPNCRFSKSITTGVKCPSEGCSGELIERKSSRGNFYGCSSYPKCTYTSRTLPNKEQAETDQGDSVEDA